MTIPYNLPFSYEQLLEIVLRLSAEVKQDLVHRLMVDLVKQNDSETFFWESINLLDWTHEGDNEKIIQPLVQFLSQKEVADIELFAEILSQKLAKLDHTAWRQAVYPDMSDFSADEFLYIRCCVVANGRDFYDSVLRKPADMPQNLDFEPLLYVAEKAYRLKTGKDDWAYVSSVDRQNLETALVSEKKGLQLSDFSFAKSRQILAGKNARLSDAVIEERRSYV